MNKESEEDPLLHNQLKQQMSYVSNYKAADESQKKWFIGKFLDSMVKTNEEY